MEEKKKIPKGMPKMNERQKEAIKFIDRDMLVSASAGSGKTTVMVEKILKYLEKGSITRIVVLTFTRASAADMREKLTERLSSFVRQGGEDAEHYREQLNLLPFAYIGTIDSICGQIYKRYFEELGVSPKLDMLDAEESQTLMSKAIDKVFADRIDAEDEDFQFLAYLYSNAKSLEGLKEALDVILKSLSAQEYPNVFIENAISEAGKPFLESRAVKTEIARCRNAFKSLEDAVFDLYREVKESEFPEKRIEKAFAKLDEIEDARSSIAHATDETIFDAVTNAHVKGMKLPQNLEYECVEFFQKLVFLNARVVREIDRAKELFGKPLETCQKEDLEGQELVKKLLGVVKEIRATYAELKREEGKADFEDVERYALAILQNETKRKEFSEGIDYIFLDEYQDTNRLQEAIFKKIARDNVFMVGDVKQAIYGFREADPQIFLSKYELYKADVAGKNVLLNQNFRSDQKILSFTDQVFSEVMTADFGGIDYKSGHAFGDAGLDVQANGPNPIVEVAVFPRPASVRNEADTTIYSVKNGEKKEVQEKAQDLYIADRIMSMVGKDLVRDKKTGKDRPIRYGDICVLYRTTTKVPSLIKIFEECKIPYFAEGVEGQSGSMDVDAVNGYLRIVDNLRQDKYLVGAMLSGLGGFNEKELAEVRAQNYDSVESFHEALLAYEGALKVKIDDFLGRVNKYRKLSALVDVPTLIEQIMTESGYLSALLAEGKTSRIETYNSYVHLLRTKKFAKDLPTYIDFLDSGIKIEIPVLAHGENAVTIMTVHKSKGLEFPVVFVARTESALNKKSGKQAIVLDSEYGVGINFFEEKEGVTTKTTRRLAIERAIYKKQNDEALRLMYVAFTRAKYRLYITGSANVNDTGVADVYLSPEEKTSFLGWVLAAAERNNAIEITKNPTLNVLKEGGELNLSESYEGGEPLFFTPYPYLESTVLSNKYTVTGLNREARKEDDERLLESVEFGEEIHKESSNKSSLETQSIEKGIAYHKVMEEIDFNIRSESAIGAFVKGLEDAGSIPCGVVDAKIIKKVLDHPLFDVARKGKCLREQEFLYYAPISDLFSGVTASDKTLVQGIMDLVVEGEENMLLDYKVSDSPVASLKSRYATQIALYAKAYEEMTGRKLAKKAVFVLNRGEVIEF